MKFLLDENVHKELFSFLTELKHDVTLSPKSVRNGRVFEIVVSEKRILVTRDSDFLNSSLYPSSKHFGIFLLRIPPEDFRAQQRAVSRLLKQVSEFKGEVIVLLSEKKFEFL